MLLVDFTLRHAFAADAMILPALRCSFRARTHCWRYKIFYVYAWYAIVSPCYHAIHAMLHCFVMLSAWLSLFHCRPYHAWFCWLMFSPHYWLIMTCLLPVPPFCPPYLLVMSYFRRLCYIFFFRYLSSAILPRTVLSSLPSCPLLCAMPLLFPPHAVHYCLFPRRHMMLFSHAFAIMRFMLLIFRWWRHIAMLMLFAIRYYFDACYAYARCAPTRVALCSCSYVLLMLLCSRAYFWYVTCRASPCWAYAALCAPPPKMRSMPADAPASMMRARRFRLYALLRWFCRCCFMFAAATLICFLMALMIAAFFTLILMFSFHWFSFAIVGFFSFDVSHMITFLSSCFAIIRSMSLILPSLPYCCLFP